MARRKNWWESNKHIIPQGYLEFIKSESAATQIAIYNAVVIPGILQTESYAHCATRQFEPVLSKRLINNRVKLRMERQWQLFERKPAPAIRVLIEESVLLRSVGGAQVQKEQLIHLVGLVESNRILLQITPVQSGAIWPMLGYPYFVLFETPEGSLMSVENIAAQDQANSHSAFEINHFRITFDNLCEQSLSSEASLSLVKDTIDQITTGTASTWMQASRDN